MGTCSSTMAISDAQSISAFNTIISEGICYEAARFIPVQPDSTPTAGARLSLIRPKLGFFLLCIGSTKSKKVIQLSRLILYELIVLILPIEIPQSPMPASRPA